ncbi:TolC family protein [Winogradskyella sp. A2]|uniref:TolC family protein n=1 Tax=Winogradskyella sp. A2 TaxID=3366944 RepID=UPI00398C7968
MISRKYIICVAVLIGCNLFAQNILSKEEAIQLTLENNYGVKIANNNVELAENNKSVLNSGYLPTLTANAGATYNKDNLSAEFSSGESTSLDGAESSRYNAGINLNYTLFDGLGRYYDFKRLKEEYNLSELQARETIENTILQLLTVYYDVARRAENLKSLEQTLEISYDRLVRSEYQFDYGQNTKLDVLNAQVDINNDSINVITSKQNLINSKRDLNVVTGNSIDRVFAVDTSVTFLMQLNKQQLLEKVLSNNVTLIQNDKNIAINDFTVKANKSGYLPIVGLIGTYGWNENNNNAASFVAVSANTGLSAGVNLSWNLFDGGTTITRVKNAKINLENLKLQKEQLKLEVERNFNNAWDDYQNRLKIYRVQEENIKTAKNNFNRTQEKFKLGQVTSIEFRQAQFNLLTAELSRNQAKYDAKLAEVLVLQISGELLNVRF